MPPNPNQTFPLSNYNWLCFLKNTIKNPNIIVGGNPAQEIKKRFLEETIEKLLALAWWDWDMERASPYY